MNLFLTKTAQCLFVALFIHSAASATQPLKRYQYTKLEMGVQCRITTYAHSERKARAACASAFERIDALEDIMSDYRSTSELNRLSLSPACQPVKVSTDLFNILEQSQALATFSDGAFDITVGPLIQEWRKARKVQKMPAIADLRYAKSLVNWRNIKLNKINQTATLVKSGMRLDLGGIGKGYACDAAIRILRRHGLGKSMIEMGGDIAVGDAPPNQMGWKIAIDESQSVISKRLTLANCGISTSGDTVQFVQIGEKRYSHVIDPRTGWALTNRVTATVIAPNATLSDGLSTAIGVLGATEARRLLTHYKSATAYVRSIR